MIADLFLLAIGACFGAGIAAAVVTMRERISMALEADEEVRRHIAALDQLRAANYAEWESKASDTQDRSEL